MLGPLSVELIGTFVFITVIFRFAKETWGAFPIGLALAAVILFGGAVSGGHFNPAVSVAMFFSDKLTITGLLAYVIAQVLGGCGAWAFVRWVG